MSSFKNRAAQLGGVLHARSTESGVQELPLADVVPDPEQPRKEFDEDELAALAKSIAKRGVLQPITVRSANEDGKYVIRFGERRWRASGIAGKPTIRAIVSDTASETENLVEQVIENEQRADLRTSEMVAAVQRMLADGMTKAAIADELACKPAEITQYAALPQMADYLRALIDQWPRRALYDLHIAARQFPDAIERFVAKQRGQGVTAAAVANFVRDLKEADRPKAQVPAVELAEPQPLAAPTAGAAGSIPAAPDAASATARPKGRRKASPPPAPVLYVTVEGRAGRLILPETVSVLFDGAADPVAVSASELSIRGAST